MIDLRGLGPIEVRVDGAAAPAALLWRKHLALLVYLARSPKRGRTREHLVGLLWGDKSDAKARRSLNEALRVLRRSTGAGGLRSDSTQVRVMTDAVELDTDRLEALAGTGDYAQAAALVQGEFLEGFSVPGAPEFDLWLTAEREFWRRRSVDVLIRRVDQLLAAGIVPAATDMATRACGLDWRSETAVRAAMRGLALAQDRAGALALFETFATRLKQEFGAEPDADTRALAERIRQERVWQLPQGVASQPAAPSRHTPLVGRALELERLVDAWTSASRKHRLAMAVIEGDAGTGKTRLAEELLLRARLDGAAVAAVRAVQADRADPWSGVGGIARGGLLDAPGAAGAPPPMLAQLRGTAPAETPGRALSEVLRAIAEEQPVLVFVDDAHWLDRESLLALEATARDLAQSAVLCLLTTARQPRAPELDELRTRVGRELAGTTVTLKTLSHDDLRELARLALPSYGAAELERLTRRVLADSAGIPLLVTALLSAVGGGLNLSEGGRAWPEPTRTLNDTLPGELPDNVTAAVRVNFRRLTTNGQAVLVAAAVLGGRSSAATLARASGVTGNALAEALDELEWHRWLTAEQRGYAFVARIVRDVVERDMTVEGERQRIREAAERAL